MHSINVYATGGQCGDSIDKICARVHAPVDARVHAPVCAPDSRHILIQLDKKSMLEIVPEIFHILTCRKQDNDLFIQVTF